MNKLLFRNKCAAVVASLGLALSVSANAQHNNLEQALTAAVVSQGQQLMQELSNQLQTSIATEVKQAASKLVAR